MPPRRPCPPQYSPPHPGRWRAASRAAPTRWYGLQPGDTRGHTVWTGTACGGADCKGDSTRIAKGILHASLHLSLRHEVARLIVWQVIPTATSIFDLSAATRYAAPVDPHPSP